MASDNQKRILLSPKEILYNARRVVQTHFSGKTTDPIMVASIALIESSGDANAYRWEAHINEASSGLCQTLLSTAVWLAKDMGYKAYGVPTDKSLRDPETSLYLCGAYLTWLSDYGGESRSEEFIVRGYNGGPNGIEAEATEWYWTKYQKAKKTILSLEEESTSGAFTYYVVAGDTVGAIARAHNCGIADILAANPGLEPTLLQIGQTINISLPSGSSKPQSSRTHTVQPGEYLGMIASRYGVAASAP